MTKLSRIRSAFASLLALCLLLTMLPAMSIGVAADYTDVTLTVLEMGAQSNRYLITLDGVPDNSMNDALYANNTVYLDGVALTGTHYATAGTSGGTKIYYYIGYSQIVSGATTAAEAGVHTLRLAAGSIIGGCYRLTNDLYFYLNAGTITQLTPATVSVSSVHNQGDNSRYLNYITLYDENENPCDTQAFSGFTSYIDDAPTTAISMAQCGDANDGELYYIINYSVFGASSYSTVGIHTVELRAGTVIGNYILTNGFKLGIRNGTIGVIASEVTSKSTKISGYAVFDNSHWRVTAGVDQVPTGGDPFFYGLTFEYEGITTTNLQFYRNGTAFMFIMWGSGTAAPADGATITAKAGRAINGDCTAVLHLAEDLTVKYCAATAEWYVVPNPDATVSLTVNETNSSTTSLYFYGDNALTSPAWNYHMTYATPDSGVYYNGSRIAGAQFQNFSSGQWYLGNLGITPAAGDEMVIKGYFRYGSTAVDVYFEELTLEFDGTKWGLPSEDDSTVHTYATGIYQNSTGVGSGHWRIYLTMSALPSSGGYYTGLTFETSGCTITEQDAVFYKTGDYFMVDAWEFSTANPTDGTSITFHAGTATNGTDTITLDKDIQLKWSAGRASWYLADSVATPLVTTTLTLNGTQTGTTGVYFKGDNIYETPAWGSHLSSADITGGVYFNGTYVSGALFQNHANGQWYLGSFGKATTAGDTLRIVGNFVNGTQGRVVCFTDVTFIWTGTQWAEVVIPDESDVTLSLNADQANAVTNGIYLVSSDSMPVSGWTNNVYSTWIFGQQNGVLLNGVMTDVYLRKYAAGQYYVCLADKGIAITTGDIVTVQGAFSYDGYTVDFAAIDLMWDGSKWCFVQTVTPTTMNSGLDFNATPTDSLAYSSNSTCNYYFFEGGVWVNGVFNTSSTSRLIKLGENRYYVAGFSAAVGDTCVIDGMITDGTNVVRIARTNFVKTGDSVWEIAEADTYDKLLTLTLDPSLSMIDGDLHLNFTLSSGVTGTLNEATFTGLSVLLGSTAINPTFTKDKYGNLEAVIPAASLPSGEYTAIVKKGILTATDGSATVYVNKEASVYVNNNGIGADAYVTRTEDTAAVSGGTASSLTFTVSDSAISGTLAAMDEDSGVFVNGVRVKATVTKSGTTVTVTLANAITANDTVMLSGVWGTGDTRLSLATAAATWDGSAYAAADGDLTFNKVMSVADSSFTLEGSVTVNGVEYPSGTALYKAGNYTVVRTIGDRTVTTTLQLYREGDLNQDDIIDICDLVLQKRYNSDNTVDVCQSASVELNSLRLDIIATTKTGESLPSGMLGETGADKFITSVTDTNAGTVVIGMADSNNGYRPNTDSFNDYGFDWVIDLNVDRPVKILQLTDTQIIDAAQERYESRLGDSSDIAWAPENMDALVFDCIRATVAEAKPDLILLTGDNVYGEFDDAGTSWLALIEVMESLQIPWAPIYGNHDNESRMGVEWQNAQLQNATYCLFVPRHEIGGNGNYSIGVAKNGELQRAVYMMDTNYCMASEESDDLVKKSLGFTDAQKDWVLNLGLRVNSVAGKTIPSILGYHVENHEVWLGAIAAGYEDGSADLNSIQYTLGEDVTAQPGDIGFKLGRHAGYKEEGWLEILQTIGADGTFFGHQHVNSLSVMYGGIRWTYGLKTGAYDQHPSKMGGTLITLSDDGSTFTVSHIVTQTE